MKINWGTGIAIFYSLFVVAMISMVFYSTQNKSHLVQENYYNKDLNYEEFRVKRENGIALAIEIKMDFHHDQRKLSLCFPEEMINAKGDIALFRPSDKNLDRKFNIVLDENRQMDISMESNYMPGLWYVQFEWNDGSHDYYKEQSIVL